MRLQNNTIIIVNFLNYMMNHKANTPHPKHNPTDSTFNICSFSEANRDTEPKTSLKSFRYKFELSTLDVKNYKMIIFKKKLILRS